MVGQTFLGGETFLSAGDARPPADKNVCSTLRWQRHRGQSGRDDCPRTPDAGPRTSASGRVNIITVLIAAVLLFALGWFVYDRYFKSEEDRIRDLLGNAAQAARDRSPSGVSAILSNDFRGPEGLDKDMVHGYAVAVLMQQYRKVEVTLLPEPIPVVIDSVEKKNATAQFRVTMRGKVDETSSWDELPRRYAREGGIALKASFKKTDQGWRMNAIELVEDGK